VGIIGMTIDHSVLADARALWDYHRLGMTFERADVILGLGSYDPTVAEHAADLFLAGRADWLMFTGFAGKHDNLLKSPWGAPEAEVFREIAVGRSVPPQRIVVECEATNTGENLLLSMKKLAADGIACRSVICVTKPNMERRVRATARLRVPDVTVFVTSPPCEFDAYCLGRFDPEVVINLMVGDLQRIERYPALGYQAAEDIPTSVKASYERLVAAGFNRHLIEASAGARPNNERNA
jgi:uncharacterized SAM-binding protein YcdF (DUF218 family)